MAESHDQRIACPLCPASVRIPLAEMIEGTYRLSAQGEITLISVPASLQAHLASHASAGREE